ncbi:hypothetical protein [Candidatus Neoehrlichia procyonis]|uniref:Transmembrane protein n=1 Tax=Candidatus Neoehrlichia procyonis str. RAC413 TaxID=1359163 RepID=A0A0F3NPD2_9RICK|nr:hypothetical protein [Candidatus Neoehrlichia lotoris]KJV68769.1 hypothetical protein NLO413_0133 [Candidatus Neoehrlichia lotoris str. RAC413]
MLPYSLVMGLLKYSTFTLCIATAYITGSRSCNKHHLILTATLLFASLAIVYALTTMCYKLLKLGSNNMPNVQNNKQNNLLLVSTLNSTFAKLQEDFFIVVISSLCSEQISINKLRTKSDTKCKIKIIKNGQNYNLTVYSKKSVWKSHCTISLKDVSDFNTLEELESYIKDEKLFILVQKRLLKENNITSADTISKLKVSFTNKSLNYHNYLLRNTFIANNENVINITSLPLSITKPFNSSYALYMYNRYNTQSHSHLHNILSQYASSDSLSTSSNIASMLLAKYIKEENKAAHFIYKNFDYLILNNTEATQKLKTLHPSIAQHMLDIEYQHVFIDAVNLLLSQYLRLYGKLHYIMQYSININNQTLRIYDLIRQELQSNKEFVLAIIIATHGYRLPKNAALYRTNTVLLTLLDNSQKELLSQIQKFLESHPTLPDNNSQESNIINCFIKGKFVQQYCHKAPVFSQMPTHYFILEMQAAILNCFKQILYNKVEKIKATFDSSYNNITTIVPYTQSLINTSCNL